jgi:hypothetical protein
MGPVVVRRSHVDGVIHPAGLREILSTVALRSPMNGRMPSSVHLTALIREA